MVKERKNRRKKAEVESDILFAVGNVLKRQGFAKLGINIVAKEANIDKTVIYRHFNTFNELLIKYLDSKDYWLNILSNTDIENIEDYKQLMKDIFISHFETFFNSEEQQQLLIWELLDKDDVTRGLTKKRDEVSLAILGKYNDYFKGTEIDINSISAILVAGIYFLVLNKNISSLCHININSDEGKHGVVSSINLICDLIFSHKNQLSQIEQIAKNAYREGVSINKIGKITGLSLSEIKKLVL